jgi:L-proline 3-hydroxylase, C-terminal/Aspartyl/Asparaginyl beta-hydroxylase
MESRIIGKVDLDLAAVSEEVDRILTSRADSGYTGYSFGTWGIYLLWNSSGETGDSTLHEFEGPGRTTPLCRELPYLRSVIERTFRTELLKWTRAFLLRDGSIIPHRDYLEFRKPLTRIHLALFTDEGSLHSEDDSVFQMRSGEVWYLAAGRVHSAASLNDYSRVVICMEFDLDPGEPPEAAFRHPDTCSCGVEPKIIRRPQLTAEMLDAILGLGRIVNERNYKDIVQLLSRVHFYSQTHAGEVFEWLTEIARRSGNPALLEKTAAFKRNCIESREMYEEAAI